MSCCPFSVSEKLQRILLQCANGKDKVEIRSVQCIGGKDEGEAMRYIMISYKGHLGRLFKW